jgi:hypothetical protein
VYAGARFEVGAKANKPLHARARLEAGARAEKQAHSWSMESAEPSGMEGGGPLRARTAEVASEEEAPAWWGWR